MSITPKRLLALTAKWLLIATLVILCTLYVVDELSFQYHIHSANSADAFGSVDMQHMLAIGLKNGKVEYTIDRVKPPETRKCVYSLFPHGGLSPCWYVVRQSRKAVPMLILVRFGAHSLDRNAIRNPFDTPKSRRYPALNSSASR